MTLAFLVAGSVLVGAGTNGLASALPPTSKMLSVRRLAAGEALGPKKKKLAAPATVVSWESSYEQGSRVRNVLLLPEPTRWNGCFCGVGNGGRGGLGYPTGEADRGFASAATDIGASAGQVSNRAAVVDFAWRATHGLAVEAKTLTERFYGRKIRQSLFTGGSTGGGQGLREVEMFPEDYDAVVVTSPCLARIAQNAMNYWHHRQLFYPDGRPVLTAAQVRVLYDAAIAWFADKDEPYARGRFLSDTRYDRAKADGILDAAARCDACFSDPEVRTRVHRLWEGAVVDGRHLSVGFPMAQDPLGKVFVRKPEEEVGFCWSWHTGKRLYRDMTWKDFDAFRDEYPFLNCHTSDLSRFRDRGGKLVIIAGGTDCVVPQGLALEWYERMVAATCGGDVRKAQDFARLYVVQLTGHGSGHCGIGSMVAETLRWNETGEAPGTRWARGTDLLGRVQAFPVAVYPMKTVGDETTGWREEPAVRYVPVLDDRYFYSREGEGRMSENGQERPFSNEPPSLTRFCVFCGDLR